MDQNTPDEVAEFLTDLQRQEVSPRTLVSYQSDLTLFARWFIATNGEAFTAAAVTPTDVRDYKAHLVSVEHRAPATVNRRLAALRKFFAWAKAERRVTELPTDNVKLVQAMPRAPKSLEKREVDALLRKAEQRGKKRDIAILAVLRHTGIRVSELVALRLADLDVGERHGRLTVRSGKGSKYRQVPVNADARRAVAQYLAVRPRVTDDHLFLSQKGGGMQAKAVQDLVARYARQAGLEDVSPHTLRHSFGKHTLDAGASLVAVAALLGHENINTTAIYTQPSERDLERAVERLEWDHTEHEHQQTSASRTRRR
jgi:integrase/recombinase XerC